MAGTIQYKCPCCGGSVGFDSAAQKMKCPYCDTEFDIQAINEYNESLRHEGQDHMEWESSAGKAWDDGETNHLWIYSCQSCGGEIIGSETLGAASCPYCGNNVVMTRQFLGTLKPDYVIPFKVGKEAVKAAYKNYIKGKSLLPKFFKDENLIEEIKGIYVPFWLFDTSVVGNANYKGIKIRMWRSGDYQYTKTSYYGIKRAGSLDFQKIPVDGSTRMPDDLMESIEPFDFSQAVDFNTAYLAGFLADKYDVDDQQSIARANVRIKRSMEEVFASTISPTYQSIIPESSSVRLTNSSAKYALYPVWILNTVWQGNKYTFAMNGQTGKFTGNLPIDKKKYALWHLLWGGGFSVLMYLILWLVFMMN